MQKTIGGDRLGSGKKMKVNLHGFERSTHDLGYVWRSTMAAGTLVPFLVEVALPGDTFDINLQCDMKTHPTIGPLFGSYKVQLDIFQAPMRLYNSLLHNNALGIGMKMANVKLPQIEFTISPVPEDTIDFDNAQINPSSIFSYLGIRGVGTTTIATVSRQFNAIAYLAYWEIYKNYYANKQEEIGAVLHTPTETIITTVDTIEITEPGNTPIVLPEAPASTFQYLNSGYTITINYLTAIQPILTQIFINTQEHGWITADQLGTVWNDTGTALETIYNGTLGNLRVYQWRYKTAADIGTGKPAISTFDLANIDTIRNEILAFNSQTTPFVLGATAPTRIPPYSLPFETSTDGIMACLSSQEGLALKTYQSDLFNNWLQTEWIDGAGGISEITAIDTSGGDFTIDTLNLAKKVYDMLNRIAISGGSYDDWLDAVYTENRHTRCESPIYHGGLSKELVFQEVVSNSQSDEQPLGTLAGKGVMSGKHKGGKVTIKVEEPSYLIGLISLTPRIDYSQGNKWDVNLKTIDDLHKPSLDEIGFQELITEQLAWWTTEWDTVTSTWIQKSAGKQPAWLNYMTNVNQVKGNFAINTNEMFMTLNRRYEFEPTGGAGLAIKDLSTYIDPSKFNFIFAETSLDAQNFWAQIAVDITARRKMSARIMPNL